MNYVELGTMYKSNSWWSLIRRIM